MSWRDFAKVHCRIYILGEKKKNRKELKCMRVHLKSNYKLPTSKIVAVRQDSSCSARVFSGNVLSFCNRKLCQGRNCSHAHLKETHSSV